MKYFEQCLHAEHTHYQYNTHNLLSDRNLYIYQKSLE